jgi:hypothetical protein
VLPPVAAHGRVSFRQVRCPHRKEELLAEMVARSWQWFVRLVRCGKDVLEFVSARAAFAARSAGSGRRLCGHERSRDALSLPAQRKRGFAVRRLPDFATVSGTPLDEALTDNTASPVPDPVAVRQDFPRWRCGGGLRDRGVIDALMLGSRALDIGGRHGLSPARVSQLRRAFRDSGRASCGEAAS